MGPAAAKTRDDTMLGILAGGRATRLGGIDKAWLQRDGVPQVLRIASRFGPNLAGVIVSANRDARRYAAHGLRVVADRQLGIGPLAGLDALAAACTTSWLLTVPVDLVDANDCLGESLLAAGMQGAFVEDDDGLQPLVALWPVDRLRATLPQALDEGDYAVQSLQQRMGMMRLRLAGVRLGNLNRPEDLTAAGIHGADGMELPT